MSCTLQTVANDRYFGVPNDKEKEMKKIKLNNISLKQIELLQIFCDWIFCFAGPLGIYFLNHNLALIFILGVIATQLARIGNKM